MLEELQRSTIHWPRWLWNLLLIMIAVVVGLLIKLLLSVVLHRATGKTAGFSVMHAVFRRLGIPLNFFLPILLLNMLLPFMQLPKGMYSVIARLIEMGLIISFGALLIGLIGVAQDVVMHAYDLKKTDNLRERRVRTQLQFVRKFLVSLVVVLVICAILLSFDNLRKIGTGLLTGVGVGGIIVGFAAQRSLSNFLAGFQIAFTQPIRMDDVLVVEGEWGRVEEITLTYVVLSIWDQRRLILPINYFIEKPFQNWTRNSSEILGTVFLYLDYSVPVDDIRAEVDRLLENHSLWDKRVKAVQVTNTTERTMEVRVLISAATSGFAFDLRCFLREKLIAFVKERYPESLPLTRAVLMKETTASQTDNR